MTLNSGSNIERNVKTIAALGAFVLASMIVTICVVQHTLGKSITQLSDDVVPIQSQLVELNDSVGRMFLSQSNLERLNRNEIEQLENDKHDESVALNTLERLHDQLGDPEIVSNPRFPKEAASRLDDEVDGFLQARQHLFDIAKQTDELGSQFQKSHSGIDADLNLLLQETAAISGILRLNYVLEMREIAHHLATGEPHDDHVRGLIVGDTRIQTEAIDAFNLSAQQLNALAGRIAAAKNIDVLNSLSANEVAQTTQKLQKSLDQIERVLTDEAFGDRLEMLKKLTNQLISRIDASGSNQTLASKRREILLRTLDLYDVQRRAEQSAHALQQCTSELTAFSEAFAENTSQTAESTIVISRTATGLIVLIGLASMVIAAIRVRTSVLDLRTQNQKLSDLSNSLAEVNSGLEQAVKQRTASLQLVLDSTGDGIFTVDTDGSILPERSKAVVEWFGEPSENAKFWDYLAGEDSSLSDDFWMGFEQIVSEIFPFEVAAAQAPSRLDHNDRTYELDYREVSTDGTLNRVLIIVKDITAQLEAERAEQAIKELQDVIGNLLKDRDGFCDSIRECNKLIEDVKHAKDLITSRRIIHTIKGNCAIIGFRSIAKFIHELESVLEDENRLPSDIEVESLRGVWDDGLNRMGTFLDTCNQGTIQVTRSELEHVVDLLRSEAEYSDILPFVEHCLLEPVDLQLKRLADHAARIAVQLDRVVQVHTDDGGLCVPGERLKSFWPTLVHIVRNAVDHGLESPDERTAAGKEESGHLRFSSDVKNGWIEIQLSDDGRGLDWDNIRTKATSLGIPCETDEDLIKAMFSDGFSTRDVATDYSGRGVGLGAVKAACEELGGSLSVQSTVGSGTTFIIRFPWEKGMQLSTPRSSLTDSTEIAEQQSI
ncbi:Hpt domain-containing protein [Stieleria sp. JC731]|uniref:ATP-binding protein n=1 Tax=Pirellulaceae TaxID=2691357 RepID=UPI001E383283|nr:ATP-binding protein [Stieleria sp. JC731]MCC9599306.1 Hpt domain-containing protein [Stieleria sp. JC731]